MAIEMHPYTGTGHDATRARIAHNGLTDLSFFGETANATQTEIFHTDGPDNQLVFPRESLVTFNYDVLAYNYTDHAAHLVGAGRWTGLCNAAGVVTNVAGATSWTALVGTAGHMAFDINTVQHKNGDTLGYLRARATGLANKVITWNIRGTLYVQGYPLIVGRNVAIGY